MSSLSADDRLGAVSPIPWPEFVGELLALYAPPMRAQATLCRMRYVCDQVAALGVQSTAEIGPPLVARFIAARPPGQSSNTTHGLLCTLRTVCSYAEAQGYCRCSPFRLRKQWVRKAPVTRRRHHSREEIASVLALMQRDIGRKTSWAQWRARRLYTLASVVAYTGLRKMEALCLRVEDVDLAERMLYVRPRAGGRLKTERSAQPVPIPEALMPILIDWLPHLVLPETRPDDSNAPRPKANPHGIPDPGWLIPNAYRTGPWTGGPHGSRPIDRMHALGDRAGVEGFTFQSLRHSWATHAEFWGLSDLQIQRVLRHTNTRTQEHYRHADGENLRRSVNAVSFGGELTAAESAPAPELPAPEPPEPPKPRPANWPKLDTADAVEMRRLREGGWKLAALAERFGVSRSTVHYTLYGVIHREAGEVELS